MQVSREPLPSFSRFHVFVSFKVLSLGSSFISSALRKYLVKWVLRTVYPEIKGCTQERFSVVVLVQVFSRYVLFPLTYEKGTSYSYYKHAIPKVTETNGPGGTAMCHFGSLC